MAEPWYVKIARSESGKIDDTEADALGEAMNAMLRGDLQPVAEYLKAGFPLRLGLRRSIVEAIEGEFAFGFYTLKLAKNVQSKGTAIDYLRIIERDLQISDYFEEQRPLCRNRKEAIDRTKAEFKLGRTKVEEAISEIGEIKKAARQILGRRESGDSAK